MECLYLFLISVFISWFDESLPVFVFGHFASKEVLVESGLDHVHVGFNSVVQGELQVFVILT